MILIGSLILDSHLHNQKNHSIKAILILSSLELKAKFVSLPSVLENITCKDKKSINVHSISYCINSKNI